MTQVDPIDSEVMAVDKNISDDDGVNAGEEGPPTTPSLISSSNLVQTENSSPPMSGCWHQLYSNRS